MMEMRKPKKSSNFRKPYLSKNKNVNVSTTVISTPPHIGILESKREILYQYFKKSLYYFVIANSLYTLYIIYNLKS